MSKLIAKKDVPPREVQGVKRANPSRYPLMRPNDDDVVRPKRMLLQNSNTKF